MNDSHVTVLPDGRDLGWLEIGDPTGAPAFFFHGTPGSRLQASVGDEVMRAAGVRLICPDRPGYGISSFHPGRRLVDWASDVASLADHLGIERFAVAGVSGGGPHSAVCAAKLADRVTVAAIVSGIGPLGDASADHEMMKPNQFLTRLARRRSRLLPLIMGGQTLVMRRWPDRALEMLVKQLPSGDVAVVTRPEIREVFLLDATRMPRTVNKAAAQDFEVFVAEWGFDFGEIRVPVHLWQGDADRNVPPSHARRMHEAIPGSVLHEYPGEGHFLVFDHLDEIAAVLRGE